MPLAYSNISKARLPWADPRPPGVLKDAYAVASKMQPRYERAWLAGLKHSGRVIGRLVGAALRQRYSVASAMRAVPRYQQGGEPWEVWERRLPPLLVQTYRAGFLDAAPLVRGVLAKSIHAGDMYADEAALEWAEAESSRLIQDISTGQRAAIRSMVQAGITNGQHPDVIARDIEKIGVGLLDAPAPYTHQMVARHRDALVEQGLEGARLFAAVQRYRDMLIRRRVEAIARTEMMAAQAHGRRESWREAKRMGLTDGAERVWVAGWTDRTCPTCQALDGSVAKIGGTYPDGSIGPPAHPKCRCTETLRYR